jgi:hypothetical protein
MTDAEIEEKFRALAGEQMPAAQVDALLRQLWSLERLHEFKTLFLLTKIENTR